MIKLRVLFFIALLAFIQLQSSETEKHPKLGLALSGGGAKGLAHIGVLKVLEEEGIQFDFITGTSMGSIVGGLYSIGYRADDLEQIVTSIEWNDLLLDKISRSNLSMEEKEDENTYMGAFPIEKWKVSLPAGLVSGQQVHSLISDLTLPVHQIEDFSSLPIPFLCIATDIEKGEAVVLDHGYLPDAIRASMSIPSAFAPIELEGQLLVDGGLVRNFPVSDVKDMGADLVIGVDVSSPLSLKKDLKTLASILNQSINLLGTESTKKQQKICDLLIEPDVDDFSILDFNDVKSIIARGEEATRKILPQIREFKKQLNLKPMEKKKFPTIDSLYINKIYVQGLRKVSKNLVIGKLGLHKHSWISIEDLNSAIERVYGSGYFQRVSYKSEPGNKGINLFIRVIEKTTDYLKFGVHYDSDLKSAVLLNGTFRNFLVQGSKLAIDLRLGENERKRLKYFIHTGWKPGFGFGFTIESDNFTVNVYNENNHKEASYDYNTNSSSFELQTIFSNAFTLRGFIKASANDLDPIIIPDYYSQKTIEYYFFSFGGYLLIDTMNKASYATKGQYFKFSYENISELDDEANKLFEPFSKIYCQYSAKVSIIKNLALEGGLRAGKITGENIPLDSGFFLGGINKSRYTLLPLVGYDFMSIFGNAVSILDGSIQWEPWEGKYLTYKANYCKIGENFDNMVEYFGSGLSIGIMTPIGPLEVTFMKGNKDNDPQTYLQIGYNF